MAGISRVSIENQFLEFSRTLASNLSKVDSDTGTMDLERLRAENELLRQNQSLMFQQIRVLKGVQVHLENLNVQSVEGSNSGIIQICTVGCALFLKYYSINPYA